MGRGPGLQLQCAGEEGQELPAALDLLALTIAREAGGSLQA